MQIKTKPNFRNFLFTLILLNVLGNNYYFPQRRLLKAVYVDTSAQPLTINPVIPNITKTIAPLPNCNLSSDVYLKKYRQQSFYIPKKNDQVITLKLTIHIFIPLSDSGRWQMNDNYYNGIPAFKYMIDSLINGHQERFSVKRQASYEVKNFNPAYIYDSKLQFEITNIYFYPERELYLSFNDGALFEYIEKNYPGRIDEGMPVVFNGSGGPGHLSSYKGNAAVVTTMQPGDIIFSRSHLLHELGHACGLGHTYANLIGGGSEWENFNAACGSIDYLSDVYPNNNPKCAPSNSAPTNAPCYSCFEIEPDTSNNIMGGRRYNFWISPLQMGRRLRNMHINSDVGRNIRQYARDIKSDHKNTWTITASEDWDFDMQLYNDIIIKAGATLTIKCKMAMAIDGKIKLEKNSKLIVDGGEITGWCKTGDWLGVESIPNQNQKPSQPFVKIINGGKITKNKIKINIH